MRRGGWEPLRELEAMQNEMRRVFGQITGLGTAGGEGEGGTWLPPLDVSETESDLTLSLDLPGVPRESIEIEVDEGTLTITGTRERRAREGERFYRVERRFGTFSRSVPLPPGIDDTQIRADFRDGVLDVRVPKPAEPQPRKIHIGVTGAGGEQSAGPPA
jgi:HSP20 family protein